MTGILIDVSGSMRRHFERFSHETEYIQHDNPIKTDISPENLVFRMGCAAHYCDGCCYGMGFQICACCDKCLHGVCQHYGFFQREEKVPLWGRSIFEVIDNLIKNDLSPDNHVFAIGCGARSGQGIFDIIGTLKQIENEDKITAAGAQGPATPTHINRIFQILEVSGAGTIRKWAKREVVSRALTDKMAVLLLNKFESDKPFLKKFVQEFLPSACRDWSENWPGFNFLQGAYASVVSSVYKTATEEDIKEVVSKAETYLLKEKIVGVNEHSIFNVRDASNVLHGCVDEKERSTERSLELWKSVEPYIYDSKPLYQSLEKAIKQFQATSFSGHQKMLFILSDGGEPADGQTTDDERIDRVVCELKTAGVTVVSCFVGDSTQIEPKRLFSRKRPLWKSGEKFMFSLSSKLPTQSLPRTMFVKRDWTIDYTNNETHLFLQVNHPGHLKEACELARNVVCCQDALCDMLASVNIDFYINQEVKDYKAKREQERKTCYANAAATVLHLSMTRIRGREGGCPDFYTLKDEIVKEFDPKNYPDGVPTIRVLEKMCPKYRLQYKPVDLEGAMKAVTSSWPVVATFRLTDDEWSRFEKFYKSEPKGTLTKKEINRKARPPKTPDDGHAVVLTSFDSECLRLLNSWGEHWGDMGFFRVKADVLGLQFIHVYWTEKDLKEEEKTYFKKFGSINAGILMELLPSLKQAEYTCPKCSKRSPVMEFTGTLSRAKCPKCGQEISTENAQEGNILALNIYLTSLIT